MSILLSADCAPCPMLGSSCTTADKVKLGTWALQKAGGRVNHTLTWEVTLTFDLDRVRLRPGMGVELGGLESFGWAVGPL